MDEPAHYEIRVAEKFDQRLASWCGNVQIIDDVEFDGTILRGEMVDQPALFGVLGKIRDLGLTLILVQRLPNVIASKAKQSPTSHLEIASSAQNASSQ